VKYERLDDARAERDRLQREHHSTVTRAAADVRASKAKLQAAEAKVRDIEFAVVGQRLSLSVRGTNGSAGSHLRARCS
jgi:hypothetical protein